jgi:hypothetical protein
MQLVISLFPSHYRYFNIFRCPHKWEHIWNSKHSSFIDFTYPQLQCIWNEIYVWLRSMETFKGVWFEATWSSIWIVHRPCESIFTLQHNIFCLPCFMVNYNLLPSMNTKKAFLSPVLIILGKHQPHNTKVYLKLLMEELKKLWTIGVRVRDASNSSKSFWMYELLCFRLYLTNLAFSYV